MNKFKKLLDSLKALISDGDTILDEYGKAEHEQLVAGGAKALPAGGEKKVTLSEVESEQDPSQRVVPPGADDPPAAEAVKSETAPGDTALPVIGELLSAEPIVDMSEYVKMADIEALLKAVTVEIVGKIDAMSSDLNAQIGNVADKQKSIEDKQASLSDAYQSIQGGRKSIAPGLMQNKPRAIDENMQKALAKEPGTATTRKVSPVYMTTEE